MKIFRSILSSPRSSSPDPSPSRTRRLTTYQVLGETWLPEMICPASVKKRRGLLTVTGKYRIKHCHPSGGRFSTWWVWLQSLRVDRSMLHARLHQEKSAPPSPMDVRESPFIHYMHFRPEGALKHPYNPRSGIKRMELIWRLYKRTLRPHLTTVVIHLKEILDQSQGLPWQIHFGEFDIGTNNSQSGLQEKSPRLSYQGCRRLPHDCWTLEDIHRTFQIAKQHPGCYIAPDKTAPQLVSLRTILLQELTAFQRQSDGLLVPNAATGRQIRSDVGFDATVRQKGTETNIPEMAARTITSSAYA
ncbi:hypothetical protein IWX90DRAFT_295718 [Phyllosticta citrichinensis]|uniref:Uncharacterized protein n=1 Tax=Phyllosticta citrichinensis TaxID=1130410 RepID=A0ABR1XKD1_9PEZI